MFKYRSQLNTQMFKYSQLNAQMVEALFVCDALRNYMLQHSNADNCEGLCV